jgi:hypothetical protein
MANKNIKNKINGFEIIPEFPHGMNLDAQMGTTPREESGIKPSFSEGGDEGGGQKRYTHYERTEELIERLGEYEQEIYEKDGLIQRLQNELDLHRKEAVEE